MTESEAWNPYAPPQADVEAPPDAGRGGTFRAQRVGTYLWIKKKAPLPPICVKCARKDQLTRRRQNFIWTPPWVYLLLLVHIIILVIVALIVRKRGVLELPLCARCNARWRNARIFSGLSVLWAFVALLLAPFKAVQDSIAVAVVLVASIVLVPLLTLLLYARPRLLRPRKIDDRMILLAGVHPVALAAIVEAGQGPAAAAPAPAV